MNDFQGYYKKKEYPYSSKKQITFFASSLAQSLIQIAFKGDPPFQITIPF